MSLTAFPLSSFDDLPLNGDILPMEDLVPVVGPKSDFFIPAPVMKTDQDISEILDRICQNIRSIRPGDLRRDQEVLEAEIFQCKASIRNYGIQGERLDEKIAAEKAKPGFKRKQASILNEVKKLEQEKKQVQAQVSKAEDALKRLADQVKKLRTTINLADVPSIKIKRGSIGKGNYPMRDILLQAGITGAIGNASMRLRRASLDNTIRLLLSREEIYVSCLYKAYAEDKVSDAEGLMNRTLMYADEWQSVVNGAIAELFYDENLPDSPFVDRGDFAQRMSGLRFSYQAGRPQATAKSVADQMRKYGNLPQLVDDFFEKGELPPNKKTPGVKKRMIDYLVKLDLQFNGSSLTGSKFDEYFANAYAYAAKMDGGRPDPVRNLYSDVQVDNFDFQVDYFDTIEEQTIDRQHIMGAGVLFYNKVLSDDLGILRVTDAVIMAWTQGRLDIPMGETATRLYRYYKFRKERTTPEERAMFYKVVFNAGNAEVLENSVVNTEFPGLWNTLMKETVKYIQKYEENENAKEFVSKVGVYNAIKNLQYNLSVFMSGMVKSLLPEMYAQLQSALDILKSNEIVQQLGQGYHRNMWKVIERVSAEAFGQVPNVSALRTIAVKGHSIFNAIAQFDEGQFPHESFEKLIHDVEEFIVANGQLEIHDTEDEADHEKTPAEQDEWNF